MALAVCQAAMPGSLKQVMGSVRLHTAQLRRLQGMSCLC